MDSPTHPQLELTLILQAWSGGDESALDRLTPIVYAELHRIAQRNMAGKHTRHLLQPSALVNEAFLRLIGGVPVNWTSRTHFYAVSARVMRQILIDIARAADTDKRGHGATQIGLSDIEELAGTGATPIDFLDLDAALRELSSLDARQAQVVELRYFGGLKTSELAEILGISEPTVARDWRMARAWLFARLHPSDPE